MSLRQEYRDLNRKHRDLVNEAQAAYDGGNKELFRQKMDEAKAIGADLEQMKADLMEMDRSAVLYEPDRSNSGHSSNGPANQLSRDDLNGMSYQEIHKAHKAGRLSNILSGKE